MAFRPRRQKRPPYRYDRRFKRSVGATHSLAGYKSRLTLYCVLAAPQGHDHSDQRLYRNYGGQIYDSLTWTDDV
jgi:hypothetical protein